MAVERDEVLRKLQQAQIPMSVSELLEELQLNPGVRTDLKRVLRDLSREGAVVREGKRFAIPAAGEAPPPRRRSRRQHEAPRAETRALPPPVLLRPSQGRGGRFVVGTMHRHRDGFAFVVPIASDAEDVFLPEQETLYALDGDVIKVEVVPGRGGRSAGRFVEVVERRRVQAIGVYVLRGKTSYVMPSDRSLADAIAVPPSEHASDGDLVKVRITRLPTPETPPEGEITENLGKPGEPKAEALEVALGRGFSDEFPPEVLADAAAVPDRVLDEEARRRRDLRALRTLWPFVRPYRRLMAAALTALVATAAVS
ncbi:MAG: ribonuclease R, partial [Myxococcales bacterium]